MTVVCDWERKQMNYVKKATLLLLIFCLLLGGCEKADSVNPPASSAEVSSESMSEADLDAIAAQKRLSGETVGEIERILEIGYYNYRNYCYPGFDSMEDVEAYYRSQEYRYCVYWDLDSDRYLIQAGPSEGESCDILIPNASWEVCFLDVDEARLSEAEFAKLRTVPLQEGTFVLEEGRRRAYSDFSGKEEMLCLFWAGALRSIDYIGVSPYGLDEGYSVESYVGNFTPLSNDTSVVMVYDRKYLETAIQIAWDIGYEENRTVAKNGRKIQRYEPLGSEKDDVDALLDREQRWIPWVLKISGTIEKTIYDKGQEMLSKGKYTEGSFWGWVLEAAGKLYLQNGGSLEGCLKGDAYLVKAQGYPVYMNCWICLDGQEPIKVVVREEQYDYLKEELNGTPVQREGISLEQDRPDFLFGISFSLETERVAE